MPLKPIIVLLSFVAIMTYSTAQAEDITFKSNAAGLLNFSGVDELIFIEESGQLTWLQEGVQTRQEEYETIDPACLVEQPNSMSGLGFSLAWPYLAAANRICKFEESTKTIRLIREIPLPVNAFTTIFLKQDSKFSYFVVLGSPEFSDGYLKLWTIDREGGNASLQDFFKDLPNYSGGLWQDGENLYVTLSDGAYPAPTNILYKLDLKTLGDLIPTASDLVFLDHFKVAQGPFSGFTFSVAGGDERLLYFNEGYESFFLSKKTGAIQNISIGIGCIPFSSSRDHWYQLCGGRELSPMLFQQK